MTQTNPATESEVKFSLSADTAQALSEYLNAHAQLLPTLQLSNEYFDTPNGDLNQQRIGCRIRRWTSDGQQHAEQTIKLAGQVKDGLHQRPEYNLPQDKQETPDLTSFPSQIWPPGVSISAINQALQCIFTVHFERHRWHAKYIGQGVESKIEIVLDQGVIEASGEESPIFEVEAELLEGELNGLLEFAKTLTSKFSLHEFNQSKAERGFALAAQAASL